MKEILLVGNEEGSKSTLEKLVGTTKFKILHVRTAGKALRFLRKKQPDYIVCAGTIRRNDDGNYVLDV